MKRDMDLIRAILLDLEASEETTGRVPMELDLEGHSEAEIMYHVVLMGEAGLVETWDNSTMGEQVVLPTRLTWSGHEFLDAAREESRWAKAKKFAMEKTGGLSFDVMKQILIKLMVESLT
jgi:hypothetical protein